MNNSSVVIRPASFSDISGIHSIYNEAVRNTTAIWNDQETSVDNRTIWYEGRIAAGYPVFVAADGSKVLGYATYGAFRPFEGYRRTVENSVYVLSTAQGQGIGKRLLQALLQRAEQSDIHIMVAGIEAGNELSIKLHERYGFVETGRMREVGYKFGQFLDLVFLQKTISVLQK
ncbi:MAG: N-acetyltransferase family protein [Hyphomicrobiales bacterium]